MKITEQDLFADASHLIISNLIQDWEWLLADSYKPFRISSFGDMFLKDKEGMVFILQTDFANLKPIANTSEEFYQNCSLKENLEDWFMIDLILEKKQSGIELKKGCVFSYIKPPILGGNHESDNFEQTAMEVHFSLLGQIHEKVKDLPDGTRVHSIKFK